MFKDRTLLARNGKVVGIKTFSRMYFETSKGIESVNHFYSLSKQVPDTVWPISVVFEYAGSQICYRNDVVQINQLKEILNETKI